jgi:hypothetical protein
LREPLIRRATVINSDVVRSAEFVARLIGKLDGTPADGVTDELHSSDAGGRKPAAHRQPAEPATCPQWRAKHAPRRAPRGVDSTAGRVPDGSRRGCWCARCT